MADQIQVRIPPHSVGAEESVLGALLLDKDAVIAVAEFLEPKDFYDERHREIYICSLELYEERTPVDVLTVSERLKKRKVLKKVGMDNIRIVATPIKMSQTPKLRVDCGDEEIDKMLSFNNCTGCSI